MITSSINPYNAAYNPSAVQLATQSQPKANFRGAPPFGSQLGEFWSGNRGSRFSLGNYFPGN